MEELVYTSASRGLQPGSSGFCTVEMTDGMPREMMDSLESLSAYDGDSAATVNWMHVQLDSIRGRRHVLSRVGALRGEFSGRTNKLAHHICLAHQELPQQGPMRIVGHGGPLKDQWSGQVRHLDAKSAPQNLRAASTPRICQAWESATGDAGVAGAVLTRLRRSGISPLWVIRTASMDALQMTDELLALLSGKERWSVTFCTYLHALPRSVDCRLRWVLDDSPAMKHLHNMGRDELIDLRDGAASILPGASPQFIDAARTGKAVFGGGLPNPITQSRPTQPDAFAERTRGVSHFDPGADHFTTDADSHALPPPPPPQSFSPLQWVMIGASLSILPLIVLMYVMWSRDPAPVHAVRATEPRQPTLPVRAQPSPAPASVSPQPDTVPQPNTKLQTPPQPPTNSSRPYQPPLSSFIGTEEKKPPTSPTNSSRPYQPPLSSFIKPEENKPPPKNSPPPKSITEQTETCRLQPPGKSLSLQVEPQSIYQGAGVSKVSLKKTANVIDNTQYHLVPIPSEQTHDLIAYVPATKEKRRIGTVFQKPDRVLFAWNRNVPAAQLAAFIVGNTLLIQDETHLTTLQFDFAQPELRDALEVPTSRFEVDLPPWIISDYQILLQATLHSATDPDPADVKSVPVRPRPEKLELLEWTNQNIDLSGVGDELIRGAVFSVRAYMNHDGRKMIFASQLALQAGAETVAWKDRDVMIENQSRSFFAGRGKRGKGADDSLKERMNSRSRKEALNQWYESVVCELKLVVDVKGRSFLWREYGGQGR